MPPLVLVFALAIPLYAEALVLCSNAAGAVFVRAQCKAAESQLDPAALGLTGPAGPEGPAGPAGPEGPAGPAGPAGALSGFEVLTGESTTLLPHDFRGLSVQCPSGKIPTGGGYSGALTTDAIIDWSFPALSTNGLWGWIIGVGHLGLGGSPFTLSPIVVCVNGSAS
jgi:hypothetical protein